MVWRSRRSTSSISKRTGARIRRVGTRYRSHRVLDASSWGDSTSRQAPSPDVWLLSPLPGHPRLRRSESAKKLNRAKARLAWGLAVSTRAKRLYLPVLSRVADAVHELVDITLASLSRVFIDAVAWSCSLTRSQRRTFWIATAPVREAFSCSRSPPGWVEVCRGRR